MPIAQMGKVSLPGVSEQVLSASASPCTLDLCSASMTPYLGGGGGHLSCFSFAPSALAPGSWP